MAAVAQTVNEPRTRNQFTPLKPRQLIRPTLDTETINPECRQLFNKPDAPSREPEVKLDKPNVQPAPRANQHKETNTKEHRQHKADKATAKPNTHWHPNPQEPHQNIAAHQGTTIDQTIDQNTMLELSETDSDEDDNGSTPVPMDRKEGLCEN